MSRNADETDVITTKSGARYRIVRDAHGLWQSVRDDGLEGFRSSSLTEVKEYLREFGDVMEPAVPGRPLLF